MVSRTKPFPPVRCRTVLQGNSPTYEIRRNREPRGAGVLKRFRRKLKTTRKDSMAGKKKIGILTGGGDVPGLNPVIKSVVYRASEIGREVVGIRRGWEGLTHMNPAVETDLTYIRPLTRENTRAIDRTGGTVLHTSRTNPRKVTEANVPQRISKEELKALPFDGKYYDFTAIVLKNLERLGVDCLVAIGGDDTLSFASVLDSKGFPLIAIPKTMDNDVQGTEYCIGFSTAITRAKELITRQRTTLGSHERIGVFRMFGRDAGFTALYTAYVSSARCLIPEYPFDVEHLCKLLMEDKRNNPSNYALVVVSEGAVWKEGSVQEYGEADAYGHRKKVDIGHALGAEIKKRTGQEIMESDLTYDLRSGEPDAIDQLVAITYANIAVDLIRDGVRGRLVGLRNGCYGQVALADLPSGARRVDVGRLYNTERYRPNYTSKLGSPLLFNKIPS
jgi:ATP-dependent phosphofructokinase / diphosphate-dependent phosphofructokinase